MLLRCVQAPPRAGISIDNGVSTPLSAVTVGALYRPLALSGKAQGRIHAGAVFALLRTELEVDNRPNLAFFDLDCFEVVEAALDPDWKFSWSRATGWSLGGPISDDLESVRLAIDSGDQEIIDEVLRRTTP
jgi:hypothetical protein